MEVDDLKRRVGGETSQLLSPSRQAARASYA
jgi:hypothetical protein